MYKDNVSSNFLSVTAEPVKFSANFIFVLEESAGIGLTNFALMKLFVSKLVGRLDIDSGNINVSLITFSSSVTEHFSLSTFSSVASVQSAILSLSYSLDSGNLTDTAAALSHVRMMLTSAGARMDVPNIVILLTIGRSIDKAATMVSIQYVSSVLIC